MSDLTRRQWPGSAALAGAAAATGGIGAKLGIETFPVDLMLNRAVILDVARQIAGGRPDPLPPGFEITGAHLDATAKAQGVEVQPGDTLLIRTGWGQYFGEDNASSRWPTRRGVALLVVTPLKIEGGTGSPLRVLAIA
jgi:kynurenine formamidase